MVEELHPKGMVKIGGLWGRSRQKTSIPAKDNRYRIYRVKLMVARCKSGDTTNCHAEFRGTTKYLGQG